MTRVCKGCGEDLPLDAFERYHNGTHQGWRWTCRQCRAPAARQRCKDYYYRYPDRSKARREKSRQRKREWYEANRERMIERAVQWRKDNHARARENERRSRARHPEHTRLQTAARRAGKGPDERDYIRVLVGDPCSYCGGEAGSIDHIVPLAADGGNEWSNLTAACVRCNSSKNSRSLLAYLLR